MNGKTIRQEEPGKRILHLALKDIITSNVHSNSTLKKGKELKGCKEIGDKVISKTSLVTKEVYDVLNKKFPMGRGRGKVAVSSTCFPSKHNKCFENNFMYSSEPSLRSDQAVSFSETAQISAELNINIKSSVTNIKGIFETVSNPINLNKKKSNISQSPFVFSYAKKNEFFFSKSQEDKKDCFPDKENFLDFKENIFSHQSTFEIDHFIPAPKPATVSDFLDTKKNYRTKNELSDLNYFNINIDSSDECNLKKIKSSFENMAAPPVPFLYQNGLGVSDASGKDFMRNHPKNDPKQNDFTNSVSTYPPNLNHLENTYSETDYLNLLNDFICDKNPVEYLPKHIVHHFSDPEYVDVKDPKMNRACDNNSISSVFEFLNKPEPKNIECLDPKGIDLVDPYISDLIDSFLSKKSCKDIRE